MTFDAVLAAVGVETGFEDIASTLDLGASAVLIALIIWLIRRRETLVSSGEWVPRRELDYTRQDRDARLAEKDATIADWRAAHETSERTREILANALRDAIEAVRHQERFFDAFRDRIDWDDTPDRGGSDGYPRPN